MAAAQDGRIKESEHPGQHKWDQQPHRLSRKLLIQVLGFGQASVIDHAHQPDDDSQNKHMAVCT